ncbi:MAG TPA: hypothetical protein DCM08_09100, partial [Microscillaceae bacterium]|nr:hypothetical protein [Microscillaceae bacterium]
MLFGVQLSTLGSTTAQEKAHPLRFLQLEYDNDVFSAEDWYYTQGIKVTWLAPKLGKSPLRKLLLNNRKDTQIVHHYGLQWTHSMYTPSLLTVNFVLPNDRPYASYMYVTQQHWMLHPTKKYRLFSQIGIGMMGPAALAEPMQRLIHYATGSVQPGGWKFQLQNDLVLQYEVRCDYSFSRKQVPSWIETIGFAQARLGLPLTDASAGVMLRLGKMKPFCSQLFSTSGGAAAEKTSYGWFYLQGQSYIVGYNATMSGGIWSQDSPYLLPERRVNR